MSIQNPFAELMAVPGDLDPALATMLRQWHAQLTRNLRSINPGTTTQAPVHRGEGLYVALGTATVAGAVSPTQVAQIAAAAALGDPVAIARGGTGATTAAGARTALGFTSKYHYASVTFQANGAASLGMGAHTDAAQFLANSNRNATKFDGTHFTDARLIARVTTLSGSANNPRLRLRCRGTFSTTITDYTDVGSSEIACSLAATGVIDSGWIAMVAQAKQDNVILVDQVGGDAAATPACGPIIAYFRGVNTEP